MNIIQTIKKYASNLSGCFLMLLVLFYLHYYEFNPIYEPKAN